MLPVNNTLILIAIQYPWPELEKQSVIQNNILPTMLVPR